MNCPLCSSPRCDRVDDDGLRVFVKCAACSLVFVPEEYHVSGDAERARYALHDNTETNAGYVRFLSEVADVAGKAVPDGVRFLDYGCGPNAVLAGILRGRGWVCDTFDPLYGYPGEDLAPGYGMIILCEVIEHLRDLRASLEDVARLLDAAGAVAVRTRCYPGTGRFSAWWYARDSTHINFFSPEALETAAGILGKTALKTGCPDIHLFC